MRQSAQLTAGVTKPYDVAGSFFYLETLPAGLLSVRFFKGNAKLDEEIEATEIGWQAVPDGGFDRIELTSSLTQIVVFHVVKGRVGVNVFSGNVSVSKPTVIDTIADVPMVAATATQILPADSTRREALISNLTANANIMRIGDANVGAARGIEVAPGQTATLLGTEAIFGFSAGAQSVGVTVIKD